ncbi:MAG: Acid phosphatase/vanadium-dependent haloperoxidase related protein [Candidatus Moranbacteria bacterium GW2011_GWE2_35_2-]|nr:MAG: Acid phosphatase/vanadium-dependent haloperoxidase related protein [Candidatus Moranbacteria bacterium GW2011_GWE2_35_2-]KKQ06581.1 MAG: Acid phosphatase/vanadium-dependent haloperoxidase related protein [Candidatus Moranbacteria bacterium GW2011_GWF1_36_4]KKQ22468.1 MAG: Acid phosphatase/vanadium-dependent haloperoxidase related protein [Candidatus Moranbacteria bacterium GW2011_GWF2_37_11]KKQ29537.1 MAG: Acid phosphatase/vanadium-dependent haloperoxidase related protein [Candidatus Mor
MDIFSNYAMFIIPLIVLAFARILKFIIFYVKHGNNFKYTLDHAMTYGHMPSVHSALMISLVTSVGYFSGIDSGEFAIAFVLAILIIDDATRLRVYMGEHSRYINMLTDKIGVDEKEYTRLKERMGHRPEEAIAGAIFGFVLTLILAIFLG